MIEVELPDGTIAEFPDGTAPEAIKGALQKRFAKPSVPEDMAKSGASGFARGSADLLGLPGTIGDALDAGGQWALRKGYELATGREPTREGGPVERFFAPRDPAIEEQMIGGGRNPLSGDRLKAGLSTVTGGATDYQPKTTAGEYARTVGEFAPSAVTGPGTVMQKAAMATVPALMSETAGQVTEGTALEPWARAGGALAGGVAAAGRVNPAKEAAKGAPTREALKAQTDQLYGAMRNAGIRYDADAFGRTVADINETLLKKGYRPSVAKDAFAFVDDLMKQVGQSPDFDDINGLVQMIGGAARDASATGNKTLASAFGIIRDKLDDFEAMAPFISNTPMPAETFDKVRKMARGQALKNIKTRALDEIVKNADTYQSGVESGIRNGVGNLLRSKKGQNLFSGEERTALLQVAQGRKGLRTLSRFGLDLTSLGGNATLLPTLGAVGAGGLGGPIAGGALLTAGTAAKAVSPRLTKRALDQTTAAVRSGNLASPSGIQRTQQLRDELIARRLLTGVQTLQSRNQGAR